MKSGTAGLAQKVTDCTKTEGGSSMPVSAATPKSTVPKVREDNEFAIRDSNESGARINELGSNDPDTRRRRGSERTTLARVGRICI
jgi:hypothetical protein